jgi:hypothetical protein
LNHLHTPLDHLFKCDKDLAQRFLEISNKLENAAARHSPSHTDIPLSAKITLEKEGQEHLKLAKERDQLLHTIRTTLHGFDNFLQPSPYSALLQSLPDSGSIIVINIHHSRSDAIALTAGLDGPLHIQLPNFCLKKAKNYQQGLMTHLEIHDLRMRRNEPDPLEKPTERGVRPAKGIKEIHTILSGLWKDVVKPILKVLGLLVSQCI